MSDTPAPRPVAAPHPYTHVGDGRWVCAICNVFIVNADCRVNHEWLTARAPGGDS